MLRYNFRTSERMPGKNRWSSTVYTGTCSERIALSGLLVVTAAAMLVAPLSARGTENTPESSHIFATEAVTATGNASPAEEIGSIVAATAPTSNPAETSPQPPTTGAGAAASRTPRVDTLTVWSTAMHKPVKNVVILPADYGQDTARRWPVVYLLHGFRGRYDTWIGKTQPGLPEAASRTGEVIVCPDGGYSSWYWDSPTDPSMRYETYVAEELVAAIDSLYRTRNGRGGRAITGYSMGGHGALYLALRHPETFGACGSMSGGVELCPFPKNWDIEKRLGPYRDNPQRWEEYSVMGQLWRAVPFNDRSREVAGLPAQDPSSELQPGQLAIFIDCGTEDYFYAVNLRLHEELLYRNVPHEFIVRPGRHTHDYWRHAVEYHLLFFRDFFAREIQPQ